MSQFYTKEQIDAQGVHMATAIKNRLAEIFDNIPYPEPSKFLGTFKSVADIPEADMMFEPTPGSYVYVDAGPEKPTELYLWDQDNTAFVKSNINPETVNNPPIEEASDISSFTTAFDSALAYDDIT